MKKVFCILVAICMLLATLPAVSMAETPVEVEYWFGLGGNLGQLFLDLIDEYNASQNAVHVTGVQYANYAAANEAYQSALAAHMPPAMIHFQMTKMIKFEKYLEPLNSYYEDPEFNKDDILAGCLSCMYGMDGETIYGAPLYASTQIMYYRKDVFEGYDIDEVFSSWQKLAEACAEIVAKNDNITFGWMPMWNGDNWLDAVLSAGGNKYKDNSMKEVDYLSDAWIDVMTSFKKWMIEDKIMGMHSGGTGWAYWYANIDDVLNGISGGYTGSAGDLGDLDFNIVAAHKQPGWNGNGTRNTTDTHMVVIAKDIPQEQKDAAWDFIKFLQKPSSQSKISQTSGYVATRKSVLEDPDFQKYIEENPQVSVILDAIDYTIKQPYDITGGYIETAYHDMVDRILLEGEDVMSSLQTCQEEAQAALDEYWANAD